MLVPAGEFAWGTAMGEAVRGGEDEEPQHLIRITRPFYLPATTPVTQSQFKRVMGRNPAHFNEARGGGARSPRRIRSVGTKRGCSA